MKTKKKMYTKKVFSRRIALKLIELGADLVDVLPNKERVGFMMYIFEVNENLDKAFKKLHNTELVR